MSKTGSSLGWILIIIILLAAAAGGGYYWTRRGDKAPEYYTAAVTRGEVVQTVTATGVIKPLLDVLVSSQISGYISQINADFNDRVKAGQLLCTLLPDTYQAAVKSAEGDLANANANFDLQKITLTRDQTLLDRKLIAQSDYDTQAALVAEAAAQVQIKQASLDNAKTNLSYCRILSPIDGIVISRNVDQGNSVSASLSSPTLYEIGNDLTKMQIDTSVAEADIGSVADNQDVTFTVDAYPNREFRGKVYQVRNAPQTIQNVVTYDVMINVSNRDLKLKPGMTANVSIIVARRADTLLLANNALRFRLPDTLPSAPTPPPAAAPAASGAKPAVPATAVVSPDERRKIMHEIFQEAGFSRNAGPPSPEVIARLQQLAKQRGIELPERFLNGGRGGAPVTVRTVYRLPRGNPAARPEAVKIKLGISDGVNTEVLDGLKEGDVIITGVNLPAGTAGRPASSPFGGGFGRHF